MLDTSQDLVPPAPPSPTDQQQPYEVALGRSMHLSVPMVVPTASPSLKESSVCMEPPASITTDAAFAASRSTEPPAAQPSHVNDPRFVSTPLNVDKIEQLLAGLGILDSWKHVIRGLREGFDVGIRDSPNNTFIFENHRSALLVRTSDHIHGH